jgi:hypothetical protein
MGSLYLARQEIETRGALVFETGQNLGVGFNPSAVRVDAEEHGAHRVRWVSLKLKHPLRGRADAGEGAELRPVPVLVSH